MLACPDGDLVVSIANRADSRSILAMASANSELCLQRHLFVRIQHGGLTDILFMRISAIKLNVNQTGSFLDERFKGSMRLLEQRCNGYVVVILASSCWLGASSVSDTCLNIVH